ncbi:unnamed protein product [Rotaria sordida]|uniref:Uncharacterized protein n=1 Tax=Rotaria sordida TaxID=392033 RepID=A0A815SVH2_9BILA|nr:unnamed protein product [Rotaria sordida]CAF1498807.1 unnamed protein product [Rotaria sordida]
MSNQRNTSNFNANDDSDSHSSSDENEEHSRTSNNHHSTPVNIGHAELASNEASHDLEPMTNEQIDGLIICPVHHNEIPILLLEDWLILMWFCLFYYQFYDLLFFVLIIYEMMNYRNRSTLQVSQSQLGPFNLPIDHYFRVDRDAQAENRAGHPVDETFTFSTTVMTADDEPLGIQDTQPHGTEVLAGLNNARPTYFIINDENGDVNEDATSYTMTNGNIIAQNLQIGVNIQVMNNNENEPPQTVVDDSTCNINPLDSVESQDDIQSSDSSDEEDPILGSESGFDGDDEYDSSDDNEERDQIIENAENLNNHQLDQTNLDNEQRTRTDTILLHNEAMEMRENASAPIEGVQQTIEGATCRTPIHNQKQTSPTNLNTESSEESTN